MTCVKDLKTLPFNDLSGRIKRVYIPLPANGVFSIFHDLLAFFACLPFCKNIVVLGVSSGVFFPLFRILCDILGKKLIVNLDGLEWRREKFSIPPKIFLYTCDLLAQFSSHKVVVDNRGLIPFVKENLNKVSVIPYPVVKRDYSCTKLKEDFCLSICRIEPENNISLLLEGFKMSDGSKYKFVGNWKSSEYGRKLLRKYSSDPKYELLDPIYEENQIHQLRLNAKFYLHGHSVGGSNPSLIEMLPYSASLICYDCVFNRYTVSTGATFFRNVNQLSKSINKILSGEIYLNKDYKEYTLLSVYEQYKNLIT